MTLRDEPVVRQAVLPDGRTVAVRIVVPDDPYIPREELDTVVVELAAGDQVLGVVETPLSAEDVDRARRLGEGIREGLESGALSPTAEGIESAALSPPG